MGELSLIFVGGLLGSSHCLGMCGGFAMLIGLNATSPGRACLAQFLYSCGRIFTYMVLGTVAGFAGQRVSLGTNEWINASAILSLLAGLVLIVQGLKATGVSLWKRSVKLNSQGCLTSPLIRTFLQSHSWIANFLAGVMTGFLPCGLLYGFLALAAASRDLLWGGAIMLSFGLGTTPMMILTGLSGRALSMLIRQRILRFAAWCVVLTGMLTAYRGLGLLLEKSSDVPPACPFCMTLTSPTDPQPPQEFQRIP